jgi:hypothetical protein
MWVNPLLLSMAAIRFISSLIEFSAAILFLHSRSLETALRVNAVLGLAGPLVFAGVSLLGLAGLAGRVSWIKLVVIFIGIILVLIGTSSK